MREIVPGAYLVDEKRFAREYRKALRSRSLTPLEDAKAGQVYGLIHHIASNKKVDNATLKAVFGGQSGTVVTKVVAKGRRTQPKMVAEMSESFECPVIPGNVEEIVALLRHKRKP